MSIIITYLNDYGIVHASDSNLTKEGSANAEEGKKSFHVNFLNAGLTIAGIYSVNSISMDDWLISFIHNCEHSNINTLEDFSRKLATQLESEMTVEELSSGSMFHIAGYVTDNGKSHPELWFVRNVHSINQSTGNYENITPQFNVTEDFWRRDIKRSKGVNASKEGKYGAQIYTNGFPPGRISFIELQNYLNTFFYLIWSDQQWKFRPPKSIEETGKLVELNLRTIITLFEMSDYYAKYIGGKPQIFTIKAPEDVVQIF